MSQQRLSKQFINEMAQEKQIKVDKCIEQKTTTVNSGDSNNLCHGKHW